MLVNIAFNVNRHGDGSAIYFVFFLFVKKSSVSLTTCFVVCGNIKWSYFT